MAESVLGLGYAWMGCVHDWSHACPPSRPYGGKRAEGVLLECWLVFFNSLYFISLVKWRLVSSGSDVHVSFYIVDIYSCSDRGLSRKLPEKTSITKPGN